MANPLNVGLFLATTLLIQTLIPLAVSDEVDPETGYVYVPASAPHDYEAYAPALYMDNEPPASSPGSAKAKPELIAFIKGCVDKMDRYCGEEIFSHIIEDTHVTKPCCEKLLKMGMKCHVTLASIALSAVEFKDKKAEGIPKSKKIWNTCVSDVGSKIGAPVPLEA